MSPSLEKHFINAILLHVRPNPESRWKQDKLTNCVSHISVYNSIMPKKVPRPRRKIAFTTKFYVQAFDKYLFPTPST